MTVQVTVVAEPGVPHIRQGREGEHLEVTQGSQVLGAVCSLQCSVCSVQITCNSLK